MFKLLVLFTLMVAYPLNGFTKYPSQWVEPEILYYPLHWAAFRGLSHVLSSILGTYPINTPDQFGRTPLHCAAAQGKTKTVEQLLALGAIANLRDINNMLPEELARMNGHQNLSYLLRAYRHL